MILILGLAFLAVGVLFLVGAHERWGWLVDPDEKYWLMYSQAFFKKVFGRKFLLYYTYGQGVAMTLAGIILLIAAIHYVP